VSLPLQWILETAIVTALMLAAASLPRVSAPVRHVLLLIALLKFAVPPSLIVAPVALHMMDFVVVSQEAVAPSIDPLFLVWAIGAAVVFLCLTVRLVRLHVLATRSAIVVDEEIVRLFAETASAVGVRHLPVLRSSNAFAGAISFGVVRPSVLVSHQLLAADEETMCVVFAHELAHHRRRDLWIRHLQTWLAVLWWFDPVFFILSRRVDAVREEACDDFVLSRNLSSDHRYCEILLAAAGEMRRQAFAIPVTAMTDPRVSLERRIRRIMTGELRRDRVALHCRLALIALAAVFLPGYVYSTTSVISVDPPERPVVRRVPAYAAAVGPRVTTKTRRGRVPAGLQLHAVPASSELAAATVNAGSVTEEAVGEATTQYVEDLIAGTAMKSPEARAAEARLHTFGRLFRSISGRPRSPSPSPSPSPSASP